LQATLEFTNRFAGAILHGGPIPWDDDVDMMIDYSQQDAFLRKCNETTIFLLNNQVKLECIVAFNAIKFAVVTPESYCPPSRPDYKSCINKTLRYKWHWPFVDLFLFKINGTHIIETTPTGKVGDMSFALNEYYPTRSFYFGGIQMDGPNSLLAENRYNMTKCVGASYQHRLEFPFKSLIVKGTEINITEADLELDCCALMKTFPFVYQDYILFNGKINMKIPI
jgi:hypothetical protein